MFTPPPSPAPPRIGHHDSQAAVQVNEASTSAASSGSPSPNSLLLSPSPHSTPPSTPRSSPSPSPDHQVQTRKKEPSREELYHRSADAKKRVARRTRWAILLVPAVLVLITVSTKYIAHPAAFDALTSEQSAKDWQTWAATLSDWQPHKRHPDPDPNPQDSGATVSLPSTVSSSLQAAPSVSSASLPPAPTGSASPPSPTVPEVPPALPTPFPQPLDTTLSQNFSTEMCETFFVNMTQSIAFRECRPFGLLLESSSAFFEAQSNLTLLNDIVWGTCNTDLSEAQCISNMAYFASSLETACSTELGQRNVMTSSTLQGLQTYQLMREIACLTSKTTNEYCYIEAFASSNVADQEFFALPLGSALPNNSYPSCSQCTQNVMAGYVQWVGNVTGLQALYQQAAVIANEACGAGYVSELGTATDTKNAAAPLREAAISTMISLMVATIAVVLS